MHVDFMTSDFMTSENSLLDSTVLGRENFLNWLVDLMTRDASKYRYENKVFVHIFLVGVHSFANCIL